VLSGAVTSRSSTMTRSLGSTLVPSSVTRWLFTLTRPAVMSTSA
jgi:hypothetical protein